MKLTEEKFLRLAPGEAYRIGRFALLGLLIQAGLALGTSAADALFLVKVGADKLPHIYILTPLMMLGYIPVYSALLARWGIDRVFDATLGALAVCGVTLWALCTHFQGVEPQLLCYAAKLYAALWYVGLYTLFWNFLDTYFDLVDAKRLFSFCAAGGALGSIIGGCLVEPIASNFGVGALFLGWAAFSVLAVPLLLNIRRRTRRIVSEEPETQGMATSSKTSVLQIFRSRYAFVLTAALFFTLFTSTVCEYQYMSIFAEGIDEATLASFLGQLTAMVNLVNLAITLFFFNKLVARFGIRNITLIQPLAAVTVFIALLLNGDYAAAAAGFFVFQGLMVAIDFNNVNLLFAGLPESGRKQIRTVIEGLGEPLATATAGIFLLVASRAYGEDDLPLLSPEELSMVGIALALTCLVFALILRHAYSKAIADNLRGAWLDFTRPTQPLLIGSTPADLDLAEALVLTADAPVAAHSLRLLLLNNEARLLRTLPLFLRNASAEAHRHALPAFEAILTQPDSAPARALVTWHRSQPTGTNLELRAILSRHGLGTTNHAAHSFALGHIETCLASGKEATVLEGLQAIGELNDARQALRLREHLRSQVPAVRSAALAALDGMADGTTHILLPEILAILPVGSAADRALILNIFERVGDSSALVALLSNAGTFTPSERRHTEQIIFRFGARTVPTLITVAQSSSYSATARSVGLRALGRLALPQAQLLAGPLVEQTTRKAYAILGSVVSLSAETEKPGQAVLRRIYSDYLRLARSIVLESLAVAGRLPNFESVLAGLDSSLPKDRGYALESVEQACDRETFKLLLPLIDRRPLEEQIAFGHAHGLIAKTTAAEVIKRALASDSPLEAAAAAQAAHELDPAGSAEVLLAKIRTMQAPALLATVFTLFARRSAHPTLASKLTPVEHVHALLNCPYLATAQLTHHEFLGEQLEFVRPPDGTVICRRGEPLQGVWLIRAGTVLGAQGLTLQPGAVVGAEALQGSLVAQETLTAAQHFTALFLPAAAIRRCIETFPELGISLLAQAPEA